MPSDPTEVTPLNRVSTDETLYAPVCTVRPAPWPWPITVAPAPIVADVVFVITGTDAAPPTAAVPAAEKLPAIMSSFSDSSAAMRTLPSAIDEPPPQ